MWEWIQGYMARQMDRQMARPPGIAYWLEDQPPRTVLMGLALQHVAIQSVFFVIPAVLATLLSPDPGDGARFLSLSILAAAIWQLLMGLTRGWVGAGYPLPASHAAALFGAYALVAQAGHGFGAAGALLAVTGLAGVVMTFMMQRLRVALPNEVAGVVVILIGIALVVLAAQRLGLKNDVAPQGASVGVALASLGLMTLVALSRTRAAPFAVLFGAGLGVILALALGLGPEGAAAVIDQQPWLALPQPWLPRFDEITPAPLIAFLVTLVALKAAAVGSLVLLQRNLDAKWSKPDAPPLRRGLLANGIGMTIAGLLGGACPNPGTAAMGLSIATGTLARRIVVAGAVLLLIISLCPKLIVLFVLVPEPVKAAMLFYVAGLIMTQGCQLVTARLLDTRRTLIVAFGLSAGIVQAVAPQHFITAVPALASPISIGALVAFTVNLITLPLVAQRATLPLALTAAIGRQVSDWLAGVAGSWALKAQTARVADQSLGELVELLQERGVAQVDIQARLAEDRVEFTLAWAGPPLPEPPETASVDDLMGDDDARQAFSVWLATRQAQAFRVKPTPEGHEAWLVFED
jgi:xanthine permease XanP